MLRRWLIRIAIAAAALSLIGYFSSPTVSPLMCKIYSQRMHGAPAAGTMAA